MDIAVIGLGLIGGSVLRALAAAGHRPHGYDADPAARAAARDAASSAPAPPWQVAESVRDATAHAELTVIAVPLPAVRAVLDELTEAGYTGLVTDVTSVKRPVQSLVDRHLRGAGASPRFVGASPRFVGGHPMAGRETSGFAASDASLLTGCAWVLCLEPQVTVLADWLRVASLVTGLGARVVPATAGEHDRAVAMVSHVPHLLAAALAATATTDPLAGTLAAGSFRDGTRVAATRPELTAAMCAGNAPDVTAALDSVCAELARANAALRADDPAARLRQWLAAGHAARVDWPARPGPAVTLPAHTDALLELGRSGGWVTSVAEDTRTVTVAEGTWTVTVVRPVTDGSARGPTARGDVV